MFWGAYDYRADGLIGIEYIIYLLTIGATAAGLMTSYTQTYVDRVYYLKTTSSNKVDEKRIKEIEVLSKWWTMFQINGIYVLLFLLANFYVFEASIPSLHFRYPLSTAGPAAAIHLCIHGTRGKENQK